jgi:hypothetical protein
MKKISDQQLLTILRDIEALEYAGFQFIHYIRPYRVKGRKGLTKGVSASPERVLKQYQIAENEGCLKSQGFSWSHVLTD